MALPGAGRASRLDRRRSCCVSTATSAAQIGAMLAAPRSRLARREAPCAACAGSSSRCFASLPADSSTQATEGGWYKNHVLPGRCASRREDNQPAVDPASAQIRCLGHHADGALNLFTATGNRRAAACHDCPDIHFDGLRRVIPKGSSSTLDHEGSGMTVCASTRSVTSTAHRSLRGARDADMPRRLTPRDHCSSTWILPA